MTKNKAKIYFCFDQNGKLVHAAYLIPRNLKYPFLKQNEACIGPCNTVKERRGENIYPYVINEIVLRNPDRLLFMLVREDNIASINGIQKAGFTRCDSNILKKGIFKRFVFK